MTAGADGRVVYLTEVPPEEPRGLFADEPEAFDVKHAARLLGVSVATVWREIERGRLRKFRVGRQVRITRQALVDYVTESEGCL